VRISFAFTEEENVYHVAVVEVLLPGPQVSAHVKDPELHQYRMRARKLLQRIGTDPHAPGIQIVPGQPARWGRHSLVSDSAVGSILEVRAVNAIGERVQNLVPLCTR
jgi:hypothetical protein